jgi:hypothetical protein
MSATNIRALQGAHAGAIVFVIASGSSLDAMPKTVFRDGVTVVCNEAYRDWPTTYMFSHHGECCQDAIDRGLTVVTSEYHCGVTAWGRNDFRGAYYSYRCAEQPHVSGVDVRPILDRLNDTLIASASTVAEAIHFAAHLLGWRGVIVLGGVDCGSIDGRWNYTGYNARPSPVRPQDAALRRLVKTSGGTNPKHVRATQKLLLKVVQAVRSTGVGVCSLSPWVGFSLEGHVFAA